MRRFFLASLMLLAACATAPAEPIVTAAPVIAAERAFAARAGEIGWIPAFREYTAPDGQIGGPNGIVSAPESLAQTPDDGSRTLYWQPAYAGIARSGDFGFTTGPFSVDEARTPRGQYFTVWRRQADGSWKWIWDGGPGGVAGAGPYLAPDETPGELPLAERGVGATEAAAQVAEIERRAGESGRLSASLAADAHVYRSGRPRTYGGADAAAALVFPAADVSYRLVRIEASEAGDLVFTLGEARWQAEGAERQGQFARIWQLRPEGWRIVYDQLAGGQ
jgi:ketosteroid isomerase-like protein